jgi:hypothetical protein
MRLADDRLERIEGAGVDVAGLRADDAARVQRRQPLRAHAALAVDRHAQHTCTSEAQQPERLAECRMGFFADHHGQRRRAVQPVRLDVPAGARQHRVARGGQRGEVGHRRAGHEGTAGGGRQAQRVEHPAERDALEHRGGGEGWCSVTFWSHAVASQWLAIVTGNGAADHEAEEAARGHRHRRRRAERVELGQRLTGRLRILGQRDVEAVECGDGGVAGRDRAGREAVEVTGRAPRGICQQVVHRGIVVRDTSSPAKAGIHPTLAATSGSRLSPG